jgi:hypothetical protein
MNLESIMFFVHCSLLFDYYSLISLNSTIFHCRASFFYRRTVLIEKIKLFFLPVGLLFCNKIAEQIVEYFWAKRYSGDDKAMLEKFF